MNDRPIGLIGGLATRAGVFYYETIVRRLAAERRAPRLMLNHADVTRVLPLVAAADRVALGAYLGSLANELFDAGAGVVAITAVAPHIAIREITRNARGPVVNVLDCIGAGLLAAGLGRVAVFGNRAVMESGIFGALAPGQAARLEPEEIGRVHDAYSDIALTGKHGTPAETELLAAAADTAITARGAEAVVLAGTDLSSFYTETPPTYRYLDLAQLHIDAILQRSCAPG